MPVPPLELLNYINGANLFQMHIIAYIIVLIVTNAYVERSFSRLKFIQSCLTSSVIEINSFKFLSKT